MQIESQGKAVEFLINSIPYPNQIKDIDLSCAPAVYFTWRSGRYKLELQTGGIMLVDGKLLIGSDASILIQRLIEIEVIKYMVCK